MNKRILNTGVQEYIRNFSSSDILSVLLKDQIFDGIDNKELVQQLEGRSKSKKKLPLWYKTPGIYYPPKQAIEQSSSEVAARYKSSLLSGDSLVDITGGLGMDSYLFSKVFRTVAYCEKQEDLAAIAESNFRVLNADNIDVVPGDGLKYLGESKGVFDWVYLDPSRRAGKDQRVFLIGDYDPPLPDCLKLVWKHTSNIAIKTSPLIDISSGIDLLEHVHHVHVVALQNEVKELMWLLHKNSGSEPHITAVNIGKEKTQRFSFTRSEEKSAISTYGPSKDYIYEPNAALLKSGAFKTVGARLGLNKLHEHSHLYTSDRLVDFPGRRFQLIETMGYSSKNMKRFKAEKANISTRNFPESVASLRKKYRIRDGGDLTLFFTRDYREQLIVLLCSRVS